MTIDPAMRSWVPGADDSDFPIQNLPYGVIRDAAGTRCGIRIGDVVFDLARAESAGLFENLGLERDTFRHDSLNRFLAHNRGVWSQVRNRVTELLEASNHEGRAICEEHHLIIEHPVQTVLPVQVGDFASFHAAPHADRTDRHLPVAHHGRAGTVVASGSPIPRPSGPRRGNHGPVFGPTNELDYELEVGFVTGHGLERGTPIPIEEAEHHIFGVVLVNDWTARDLRTWEDVALGPFLGKSFATTISPWVVPLEALEPFRSPPRPQDPPPLPYLRHEGRRGVDIDLEVTLTPASGSDPTVTCETSSVTMYWTIDQLLAHATVNGATIRPGDVFASGPVSDPETRSFGSLAERTRHGAEPLMLASGDRRTFLEDGDRVTVAGRCSTEGRPSIGFGRCEGTIVD